jgi:hypothetical protein
MSYAENKENNYILFNGKRLIIANDSKQKLNQTSKLQMDPSLLLFNFGRNNKKLGMIQSNKNIIILTDSKGKLEDGFPLDGTSLFTIGKLENQQNSFNLLVNSDKQFLLNYTLE